jgi:hypothetical protein
LICHFKFIGIFSLVGIPIWIINSFCHLCISDKLCDFFLYLYLVQDQLTNCY